MIPQIGAMKAKDVRLPHIVQVIDKILERKARRTANLTLSLMRQMFRHGLARGIVETDLMLALSRKQAGGKETPVDRNLSLDEIKELHSQLPGSGLHEKLKASIWLLLATGARVGELLQGKVGSHRRSGKNLTIPAENAKNSRAHLIDPSAFARKAACCYEEGQIRPLPTRWTSQRYGNVRQGNIQGCSRPHSQGTAEEENTQDRHTGSVRGRMESALIFAGPWHRAWATWGSSLISSNAASTTCNRELSGCISDRNISSSGKKPSKSGGAS